MALTRVWGVGFCARASRFCAQFVPSPELVSVQPNRYHALARGKPSPSHCVHAESNVSSELKTRVLMYNIPTPSGDKSEGLIQCGGGWWSVCLLYKHKLLSRNK